MTRSHSDHPTANAYSTADGEGRAALLARVRVYEEAITEARDALSRDDQAWHILDRARYDADAAATIANPPAA